MALSVLRILETYGEIRPVELARAFGESHATDDERGYGRGMHKLLPQLAVHPEHWEQYGTDLFGGQGSLGNGAVMRVAPLGAFFRDDLDLAADQAALSARVTHAHPEGVAGAVAVAVAAALAARRAQRPPTAGDLLQEVASRTPSGAVHDGLMRATDLPENTLPTQAAAALGSGTRTRADDTVPYALWCAAHHPDDLTETLWVTAEGLGDVDTTCAIAGGIVAARTGTSAAPAEWLQRAEKLPDWTDS